MDQVSPPMTQIQAAARPAYVRNTWYAAAWSVDIPSGKPFARMLLTPETGRTPHYHFAAFRWNVLTQGDEENTRIQEHLSAMRRFAFVEQDAPVIEAQQRTLDRAGDTLRPVMLSTDAGPVRYRRVLERLLREDAT